MLKDIIKEKISVLNPTFLRVIDNISTHAEHNSSGRHFHINIVVEGLKELSFIQR